MTTQAQIATYFKDKYGVRLDQARISRISNGEEPISWSFAHALSLEFPGRDQYGWKHAKPEEFKRAVSQLEEVTA